MGFNMKPGIGQVLAHVSICQGQAILEKTVFDPPPFVWEQRLVVGAGRRVSDCEVLRSGSECLRTMVSSKRGHFNSKFLRKWPFHTFDVGNIATFGGKFDGQLIKWPF